MSESPDRPDAEGAAAWRDDPGRERPANGGLAHLARGRREVDGTGDPTVSAKAIHFGARRAPPQATGGDVSGNN